MIVNHSFDMFSPILSFVLNLMLDYDWKEEEALAGRRKALPQDRALWVEVIIGAKDGEKKCM